MHQSKSHKIVDLSASADRQVFVNWPFDRNVRVLSFFISMNLKLSRLFYFEERCDQIKLIDQLILSIIDRKISREEKFKFSFFSLMHKYLKSNLLHNFFKGHKKAEKNTHQFT